MNQLDAGYRPKAVPGVALRRSLGWRRLFVLGVRFENELTNAVLSRRIGDWTQQREAAALTVDRIGARRERDVAAATAAALPDGEADQLQAVEHAFGEVQLGIR